MMVAVAARAVGRHGGFDQAVAGVIVFNIVVLVAGLTVDGYESLFEMLHNAILAFFVFELLVRLRDVGWRPREFLASRWNAFDSAVVALSLLPVFGPGTTLLRLARLSRVVHLLRHVSHLRLADLMLLRSRA